jgi:hypothetical protein
MSAILVRASAPLVPNETLGFSGDCDAAIVGGSDLPTALHFRAGVVSGGFTAIVAIRRTDAISLTAPRFGGGGFLLPTHNGEVLRWCLQNNLRPVHQMTLMTIGLYNKPAGAYIPSVLY